MGRYRIPINAFMGMLGGRRADLLAVIHSSGGSGGSGDASTSMSKSGTSISTSKGGNGVYSGSSGNGTCSGNGGKSKSGSSGNGTCSGNNAGEDEKEGAGGGDGDRGASGGDVDDNRAIVDSFIRLVLARRVDFTHEAIIKVKLQLV